MDRSLRTGIRPAIVGHAAQHGVVLVEVLVAILSIGLVLISLLTLFPVGALQMAAAVEDDRTAAIANDAAALSEKSLALVASTARVVETAIASGSIEPDTLAGLREQYECFARQAEAIESQLLELQATFAREELQMYLGPLLAQTREITAHVRPIVRILSQLERR